jgi:hypothetical protein
MFDREDFISFCQFFACVFALTLLITILSIAAVYTSTYIDVETMQQAGYSAKRVNLTCVAEYKGRWVDCNAVLKNQVQVTN